MEIVNPLLDETWDQRLKHYKEATIFHSAAWAKVLHQTYRFTPGYLVYDQGILPIMEAKSWLTGTRGVSLPFTDECEPLGFGKAQYRRVMDELTSHANARQWKYWEIRGGGEFMESIPPSLSFRIHSLDLRAGESAVFERFDSSVRRAIRKAAKNSVQAQICAKPEDMKAFYRLHCHTRQKHGLPPQPFAFFGNIQRYIIEAGMGFLVLAKREGQLLAADIFLKLGKKVVYKFGASDSKLQEFRGSNVAMWCAIEHCIRLGFEELSFGRTSVHNEGLRRFKLGWGTTEETKSYYKFDLRKDEYVTDEDRASGWHNNIFGKMPLPLLRLTGRVLYPHLA